MENCAVNHPRNLVATEVGAELSELLSDDALALPRGQQSWLLMAILYLVERERYKSRSHAAVGQSAVRLVSSCQPGQAH